MHYKILCIGKMKDVFYRSEIAALCDKIEKQHNQLEIIEFPDSKIPDNLKEQNKEAFLEKECSPIMERISNRDYVIALCVEGKEIGTGKHSDCIKKAMENEYESITYVIGGSLGLPKKIKERANLKLSLSKMTFPHQLMRMVLCEEIYEAGSKNLFQQGRF